MVTPTPILQDDLESEFDGLRKEKLKVQRMQEIETMRQELQVEKIKLDRQKFANSKMTYQPTGTHTHEGETISMIEQEMSAHNTAGVFWN